MQFHIAKYYVHVSSIRFNVNQSIKLRALSIKHFNIFRLWTKLFYLIQFLQIFHINTFVDCGYVNICISHEKTIHYNTAYTNDIISDCHHTYRCCFAIGIIALMIMIMCDNRHIDSSSTGIEYTGSYKCP